MARKSLQAVIKAIEKANTVVPVEQQFINDLRRSIELTNNKEARQPSVTYSPSGMSCIRAMYYKRSGMTSEFDSNYSLIGICEAGTDRHARIQTAISKMKDNGFDCEYIDVAEFVKSRGLDEYLDIVEKCGNETKLFDRNLHISFLCDGIIRYLGKYYIVEFKTEQAYKWQTRKGVDPKHYNQAITYSAELKLDDVLFVYINRDIVDYKAFIFNVKPSDRERVLTLINTCEEYVVKNELPPIPEDMNEKKCAYCNYKEFCKRDYNGEQSIQEEKETPKQGQII